MNQRMFLCIPKILKYSKQMEKGNRVVKCIMMVIDQSGVKINILILLCIGTRETFQK